MADGLGKGRRGAAPTITDPRFEKLHSDPRFKRIPRSDSKVKVDKRFEGMFTDASFRATTSKVDKYGRPVKSREAQIMRHYEREDESDQGNDSDGDQPAYDPARGIGVVAESSGSSSETDDADECTAAEVEEPAPESEVVPLGDATSRFACVNMDWDHLKAVDILAVLQSFAPAMGAVKCVTVYVSDFGRERMAREDQQGPADIWEDPVEITPALEDDADGHSQRKKKKKRRPRKPQPAKKQEPEGERSDSENEGSSEGGTTREKIVTVVADDEEGPGVDNEKLRQYQLDRLRYYFAVAECDSVATAHAVYSEVDGLEYEQSANAFDLRFIPNDVSFADRAQRDAATKVPANHRPPWFATKAKQHTAVELEWDKTDPERTLLTQRKFTENDLKDLDFQTYLASESEAESDADEIRAKYRGLLAAAEAEDDDAKPQEDVVITFQSGLRADVEKLVKGKGEAKAKEDQSVWDKYLERRKQKKKEFKRQQKLAKEANVDDGAEPDSLYVDDVLPDADEPAGRREGKKQTATGKGKKGKGEKISSKLEIDMDDKARAQLELMLDPDDEARNFDYRAIVKNAAKKGKKATKRAHEDVQEAAGDDFRVDVKDPRFAHLYGDAQFALDPTDPNFRDTPATTAIIAERHRRAAVDESRPRKKAKSNVSQTSQDGKTVTVQPGERAVDLDRLVSAFKKKQ